MLLTLYVLINDVHRKDPVLECVHKSIEKCHYTYKTLFVPIQEEVCDDHFVKHCTITYRKVANNETFLHCYNPLVKECSAPGRIRDFLAGLSDDDFVKKLERKPAGSIMNLPAQPAMWRWLQESLWVTLPVRNCPSTCVET